MLQDQLEIRFKPIPFTLFTPYTVETPNRAAGGFAAALSGHYLPASLGLRAFRCLRCKGCYGVCQPGRFGRGNMFMAFPLGKPAIFRVLYEDKRFVFAILVRGVRIGGCCIGPCAASCTFLLIRAELQRGQASFEAAVHFAGSLSSKQRVYSRQPLY